MGLDASRATTQVSPASPKPTSDSGAPSSQAFYLSSPLWNLATWLPAFGRGDPVGSSNPIFPVIYAALAWA